MCHLNFFFRLLFLFLLLLSITQTSNTCPLCKVPCMALHLWQAWAFYFSRHLPHVAQRLLPTRTFLPNEMLSYGSQHSCRAQLQGRDADSRAAAGVGPGTGCGTGLACINQTLQDTSTSPAQKGFNFSWTLRVKFNDGFPFLSLCMWAAVSRFHLLRNIQTSLMDMAT